ncbi:PEGA domain-containing protein [Thermococcus sp. P6]|uniref:PEGA domain-containing protein n=1 Tax=Thermococcus sp. P6 TaxID=122420 RepID=UPI001E2E61A5|nr:PEGA domain-containing protein [Thermococcus sp. P6]
MNKKALFIVFLLVGLFIPQAYPIGESHEKPGYLFVDAPAGLVADIRGVGSYITPVGLALPPGNYTLRIGGNVTVVAKVSMTSETVIHVNPGAIEDAVSGDGIVSIRAILNESANYSRERLNPPFNPLQEIPGCGFGDLYINIPKPVPMGLVERGPMDVYLIPNGTFLHLGDSKGQPCIEYVRVNAISTHMESVSNATYVVPWARLEINSVPGNLTFYVNGGHNRYIFYTPMGLYVPAILRDVHNATAVAFGGKTIRVPLIRRLDAHWVGVARDHYLVESLVKVTPNGTYRINVNMDKVELALRIERKPLKVLPLKVDSRPENASIVVTNGVLRAFSTTPATFFLPPGNYTVIASKGNLSACESVVMGNASNLLLKLHPASATLEIVTHPDNATVLLNGKEVEVRNLTLSPGRYNITLKAPGYLNRSMEVILAPNESRKIEIELEEEPAMVVVIHPSNDTGEIVSNGSNASVDTRIPIDTQTSPATPGSATRGSQNGSLWIKMALLAGNRGCVLSDAEGREVR